MLTQRDRILPPYTRRVDDARHRIGRILLWSSLLMFAVVLGFFLAIAQQYGILLAAIPLAILAGLALWMAPDHDPGLDRAIVGVTLFYFAVALIWPNYIALNLPGLPWLSFRRILLFLLLLLFAYQLACSEQTRRELAEVLASHKPLTYAVVGFAIIMTLMIPVGGFGTFGRWVHYSLIWTFSFFLCAWVFRHPGTQQRLLRITCWAAAITSLVVIPEMIEERVLWAEHIPGFLKVDPTVLETLMRSQARSIDGLYRARSVYLNSLLYAEFLAVAFPFVVFALLSARRFPVAFACLSLLILMFFGAWATNSRSAMGGMLVAIAGTVGIWAFYRYRQKKEERDIIAPAVLWAYPAAVAVVAAAVLFVPRVRVRVLGGRQHQFSNQGRERQWDRAWDQLQQNPLGHGIDQAADLVGSVNHRGQVTVDSFPINLLIDYGVLGFVLVMLMFIAGIVLALRVYFRSATADEAVAGPIAISLLALMVIRSVVSMEGAQFFGFALLGVTLATWWRQEQRLRLEAPARPPAAPAPLYPLPPAPRPRAIGALASPRG